MSAPRDLHHSAATPSVTSDRWRATLSTALAAIAPDSLVAAFRHRAVRAALIGVGALVLTIVIFHRQLFDGYTFPWDFVGAYSATPAFAGASVGHGHFFSWSPFVASGFPVAIDPQAGLYFPVWWLLGLLRVPLTLGAVTDVQIAHVLSGAVGVACLARVRRLAWPWAILAGLAYLFFGGFYGEAEHADIFRGFAYLPWLLWTLTPPAPGMRWTRLLALPLLAWLIVTGAYPGQVASFAIIGACYLVVSLIVEADDPRRLIIPVILAGAACGAIAIAVLVPYLHAQSTGELVRVAQPTVGVRAGESLSALDFLGLYLNNFAWTYDGTVTAWAVGIPVLIGVVSARRALLRGQLPLIVTAAVALALAMTPKITPIGKAMVSLGTLFPSRFPASDYKAMVAIALIVIAAQVWGEIAGRITRPRWRPAAMAVALIAGVLLAPSTQGPPTKTTWLVILIAVATLLLALWRPRRTLLIAALGLLVCVDGVREIRDYRLLGTVSPWMATPQAAAPYSARDASVRALPSLLEHPPATRPARIPPGASLTANPTGTDPDAAGWTGDGYHVIDYGGTIERSLWNAERNPPMLDKLLAPWHAYTFSCAKAGCTTGQIHLPPPGRWRPAASVTTVSYGARGIVYQVHATRPELMVENELAIPGWTSTSRRVRLVNAGLPLRAWRLSPGTYRFTATYRQASTHDQEIAVVLAVLAWAACLVTVLRRGLRAPIRRPRVAGSSRTP